MAHIHRTSWRIRQPDKRSKRVRASASPFLPNFQLVKNRLKFHLLVGIAVIKLVRKKNLSHAALASPPPLLSDPPASPEVEPSPHAVDKKDWKLNCN